MKDQITPRALRDLFNTDTEFAPIDTREEGIFARGHLLAASNLPLSRLPLQIDAAIPNRATHIVLCAHENAQRTRRTLETHGYQNVSMLTGGVSGWALEGGKLFTGVNVIGKAFGEYIEKSKHTPSIGAPELRMLLASDKPPILLDTRTPEEHHNYCIPGALGCPNGELVYRAMAYADTPERLIVTHCAGRTRSIIGAQTLIDAGIPNPVVALENGTLAWIFEDYELEKGANRPIPAPGLDVAANARDAARALMNRHGIETVGLDTLKRWISETGKTTYVIDVRSSDEYQRGSIAGMRHVPGGQLVQNVDRYLVTRNARVVLVDTDGVRGVATGAWLKQLGWSRVYTARLVESDLTAVPTTGGDAASTQLGAVIERVDGGQAIVLDCRSSVSYRRSHPAGAWYFNRADVSGDFKRLEITKPIILFTDDQAYGELVADDLKGLGAEVRVLRASAQAWGAAGGRLESGVRRLASAPDDVFFDAEDFDDIEIQRREGRAYLEWEIGLVHQLENDPGAPYTKHT